MDGLFEERFLNRHWSSLPELVSGSPQGWWKKKVDLKPLDPGGLVS